MSRETIKTEVERHVLNFTAAQAFFRKTAGIINIGIGVVENADGTVGDIVGYRLYVLKDNIDKGALKLEDLPSEFENGDERFPAHTILIRSFTKDEEMAVDSDLGYHTKGYKTLVGGIQVANAKAETGTLGCFGKINDASSADFGKRVIVSARHVLVGKDVLIEERKGDRVGQPAIKDWCPCEDWDCETGYIGTVYAYTEFELKDPSADAATVLLDDEVVIENRTRHMRDSERIQGSATALVSFISALPGDKVWKDGMRTGKTTGTVVDVMFRYMSFAAEDLVHSTGAQASEFLDALLIMPEDDEDFFSFKGDSGAAVFNEGNEVVGIVYQGAYQRAEHPNVYVQASQIKNVTDQLNIEILKDKEADGAIVPTKGFPRMENYTGRKQLPPRTPYGRIRRAIQKIPAARPVAALIKQFELEVMGLVRTNRACKVVWHRLQGPAFLTAYLRGSEAALKPLPQEINGIQLSTLLIGMAAVLEEHGSTALSAAVREQLPRILRTVQGIHCFEDIYRALETRKGAIFP